MSDYYLSYLDEYKDFIKLIDAVFWFIDNFNDSYISNIAPIYLRDYLLEKDSMYLNFLFSYIFGKINFNDKIKYKLGVNFLFEVFQYGSEWGVYYRDSHFKPSMSENAINIGKGDNNPYLSSKLSETNLLQLDNLEQYVN